MIKSLLTHLYLECDDGPISITVTFYLYNTHWRRKNGFVVGSLRFFLLHSLSSLSQLTLFLFYAPQQNLPLSLCFLRLILRSSSYLLIWSLVSLISARIRLKVWYFLAANFSFWLFSDKRDRDWWFLVFVVSLPITLCDGFWCIKIDHSLFLFPL